MKKQRILFWIILLALALCELTLAWKVQGFSDFYVKHIFPIFVATYGRVFNLFSFSAGEFLLYGAVVFVVLCVVLWICRFVFFVDKRDTLKSITRVCSKILFRLIIFAVLVQVQNCFIMYQATPLYEGTDVGNYTPTREDLIDFRETLVIRANSMAEEFERNKKGEIIYEKTDQLSGIAKVSMADLGESALLRIKNGEAGVLDEKLSMLAGFYSSPKPFFKSDFFSQQYIKGYYFPFTLEANFNNLMYIASVPDTMCHELSHLKGFILEDEASFLAYLGCMNSKDNLFIYSGTLNALAYVNAELRTELALEPQIRETLTPISDYVIFDSQFLTKEAWEEVEKDAFISTEVVSEASETFLDTNLTVNGVEDGIKSYSRIVVLLLKYYYGGVK